MRFSFSLKQILLGMTTLLSFSACNGILSGIYDEPIEEVIKEFGFIEVNKATKSGTIYIDATKYEQWIYIDFHNYEIDSLEITKGMTDPQSWDIAVHRYDTKTNGATVIETGYTGLEAFKSSGKMPEGTYVADEWTTKQVMIDVSGMIEGNIVYAETNYNPELSKWLHVDTSSMPPSYSPSQKVYVIKLKDNTCAAIRLVNYMNAKNVKGFMKIDYIYPLEF